MIVGLLPPSPPDEMKILNLLCLRIIGIVFCHVLILSFSKYLHTENVIPNKVNDSR